MPTTIASLRGLVRDLPAALDRVAHDRRTERLSERYLTEIRQVRSLEDFLANHRVYGYALEAFGLQDMAYAKAFMRRVLSEGIDRRDSLANRLADPRFRELAETFNFARYGASTTAFSRTQQGTVDRFVRQTLEVEAGNANEGVRLALYFRRKAPQVTSPYALLADRALTAVTRVVLGLPESTGALDIDRQAEMIKNRLDLADLKDPEKLDRLLSRFAAQWDAERAPAQSSTMLANNSPGGIGIDLLAQLQSLKRGR